MINLMRLIFVRFLSLYVGTSDGILHTIRLQTTNSQRTWRKSCSLIASKEIDLFAKIPEYFYEKYYNIRKAEKYYYSFMLKMREARTVSLIFHVSEQTIDSIIRKFKAK